MAWGRISSFNRTLHVCLNDFFVNLVFHEVSLLLTVSA